MTTLTRSSNLAGTAVVSVSAYAHDHAGQLTGIVNKNSGGGTLTSYGYTYDGAGRVTQETRTWASGASTDTVNYGYTNNDQLTGVTHSNGSFANESFAWDANGNQTGTGYTTTTDNRQTTSPGYTYTYDAAGDLITATQTSTGNVWTYTYDFRDRMTGAVEKTSAGAVLAQATYTYDALDRRIGMNENGTQTWTLYDGAAPAMDFTGTGSLAMRYLDGPSGDLVDEVLSRQSSGGTVSWYLPDRLGAIRDLIGNTGSIIDHVDYTAFGAQLGETTPAQGDRLMGFAGLARDTVTGTNLAVERIERPSTGRWTSQDPLGFSKHQQNLYNYVSNHPAQGRDTAGLSEYIGVIDEFGLGFWWSQKSSVAIYDGNDKGGPGIAGGKQFCNAAKIHDLAINYTNWQNVLDQLRDYAKWHGPVNEIDIYDHNSGINPVKQELGNHAWLMTDSGVM